MSDDDERKGGLAAMPYARARFDALTDGVFAVAMTLLVLDMRLPDTLNAATSADLWTALAEIAPKARAYGLSFLVVGLVWLTRATRDQAPEAMSRREGLLGLLYLLFVTLVPFSTILIGRFPELKPAILFYAANLAALGLLAVAMRLQIPETHRDDAFHGRLTGSLYMSACAGLTALLALMGWGSQSLWALAFNGLAPLADRVVRRRRAS